MKILILGNRGYLGLGLTRYLKENHEIIGWDKDENLFSLNKDFLLDNKIDILINLALVHGERTKEYVLNAPADIVTVMGTRHIADVLKGTSIFWYQISTREVFGSIYKIDDVILTDKGYRPKFLIDESYPVDPQNFFGKTKLIAEYISESHKYTNVIRLNTPYTDFFNNHGGLVSQLLKLAANDQPISLTNNGLQFRDPLHIDDIGNFIELLYKSKIIGNKYHLGGGENNIISLKELVLVSKPDTIITNIDGGDFGFAYDNSKAKHSTTWCPKISIRKKLPFIFNNIKNKITSNC